MSASALISLAGAVGAPLIERVLARQIGVGRAELVGDVLAELAGALGVAPEEVEPLARAAPDRVETAMRDVEATLGARVALYTEGLEYQLAALKAGQGDPVWMRAWRPAGMYVLGFLWLWAIVLLHVANAIWRIALPQPDLWVLFQLTALYMTLYMGGHTFKDFVSTRWGRKGGAGGSA
jgi:hypothetical protein